MKIRLPSVGDNSTRRSKRTEGPSAMKRLLYSSAEEGGIYRSSSETLILDGGTTGCGDDGTAVLETSAWLTATTALENTFVGRLK